MVDGAAAICGEARHVALRRETELEVAVDDLGLATEELIFGLVCYGRPMSLELAGEGGRTCRHGSGPRGSSRGAPLARLVFYSSSAR